MKGERNMSEEIKNEVMETETTELDTVDYEESSSSGKIGKIVLGVGLGLAAAGVVVWHKTKDKIEAKQIERLKKKGYVIYREEDVEVVEVDSEEDCEEADADDTEKKNK